MTAINGFTQPMLDDVHHLLQFLAGVSNAMQWEIDLFDELGLKLPVKDESQTWSAFAEVVAITAFVPLGTTSFEYARGIITLESRQQFHYARILYSFLKDRHS